MTHLIVGGGPIGGYTASELNDATLIDQKTTIGTPVRCTGILTDDILKFMSEKELKNIRLNKITRTRVHGPNSSVTLSIGNNHIICNSSFEQQFIDKAEKNGNKILLKHKYIQSKGALHEIRDGETGKRKSIQSKHLLGCDGPTSQVNKIHRIQQQKKQYMGYQITLKVKEHENTIDFFPYIGAYAWYVPESDTIARVGLCAKDNPKAIFEAFKKKFKGKQQGIQAGFIPYYKPFITNTKKIKDVQVSLLGDSAPHIKNTTGGGIIPGIKAADHLIKSKTYSGTASSVQRELYSHFLVHNVLKQCNNKEWDSIIKAVKQHTKDLETINRDQLWKLFPRLIKNPSFISIGMKKFLGGLASKEKNILY